MTTWLEDLRAQGWSGYSLETGELTRDSGMGVLPLHRWCDYRLHGFRHHTVAKLLRERDVRRLPLDQIPAADRALIDAQLAEDEHRWKKHRARYQRRFREAALADASSCIVCAAEQDLEAAHAIASATQWAREFDVEQAHNEVLAVTLCGPCHREFDARGWQRNDAIFAEIEKVTTRRVLGRISHCDTLEALREYLGWSMVKAREAWAFDFRNRGIPLAAGWHLSESTMLWVPPEDDREMAAPPSFHVCGERAHDFLRVPHAWLAQQRSLRVDYERRLKEVCRLENRARNLRRWEERGDVNAGRRQQILAALASRATWMTASQLAVELGLSVQVVRAELLSAKRALVPAGLVDTELFNKRRRYRAVPPPGRQSDEK